MRIQKIIQILQRESRTQKRVNLVKCRIIEYLIHVMRNPENYATLYQIIQGKIQGKKSVGIWRTSRLRNLMEWFEKSSNFSEQQAVNDGRYVSHHGSQRPLAIVYKKKNNLRIVIL